jgi:ribosomal protein L7/L12
MSTDRDVLQRIAQLEKKVTELYKQAGRDEPDFVEGDVSDEVRNLIMSGQKMDAVKLYRDQTGCDLVESQATVERIAAGG